MLTLHGIQMQDVWPPVARLEIKARVTHNDETPMQGIMDGNQKEVLAEDIYPLHINASDDHDAETSCALVVQQHQLCPCRMRRPSAFRNNKGEEAYFGPRLNTQMIPLSSCQSFDGITVWRAFAPCTYKASACWFAISSFAVREFHHLLWKVATIKHVSQPGDQQG